MAGIIPFEHKSSRATKPTSATKKRPAYDRVKTYNDHSNSAKDFNWARQAASWGLTRKELVNGLKEESPSANEKGEKYLQRTVDRAIKNSSRWITRTASRSSLDTGNVKIATHTFGGLTATELLSRKAIIGQLGRSIKRTDQQL